MALGQSGDEIAGRALRALGYLGDPSPVDRVPALVAGFLARSAPAFVTRLRRGR